MADVDTFVEPKMFGTARSFLSSPSGTGRLSEFSPSTLQRLQSASRLDRITSLSSSQRMNLMFGGTVRGRLSSASSRNSAGSVAALSKETAALLASFAPYDLEAAKRKVLKKVDEQVSLRFKHFYEKTDSAFDKLLIACIQYFVALLYWQALQQASLKAQRQKHERLKSEAVEEKIADLQKWVTHSYEAIAPLYAAIVCKCSKSRQQHNDQLFFESLYLALVECVTEVLGTKQHQQVSLEIDRMFRTPSFNIQAKTLLGVRSIDTMTIPELHALTQETLPKEMDRKLLSCLREGSDTRPHYREEYGSTLLQPYLMEKKQTPDITDPSLDRQSFKLPSSLNGVFYQKKLTQKLDDAEAELASYTVHVSEYGMVENEVTLRMAYLQRQMLQANHRV